MSSFTSSSSSGALANVEEDVSNSDDSEILAAYKYTWWSCGVRRMCVKLKQVAKMLPPFLQKTAGCEVGGGSKLYSSEVTF